MAEKVVVPPRMFACLDAKGESYVVEVDLPGVKKKDIGMSMHEDIIHVLAEREDLAFSYVLPFFLRPKLKFRDA